MGFTKYFDVEITWQPAKLSSAHSGHFDSHSISSPVVSFVASIFKINTEWERDDLSLAFVVAVALFDFEMFSKRRICWTCNELNKSATMYGVQVTDPQNSTNLIERWHWVGWQVLHPHSTALVFWHCLDFKFQVWVFLFLQQIVKVLTINLHLLDF